MVRAAVRGGDYPDGMGKSTVAQNDSVPVRRTFDPVEGSMVGASAGWYYDPTDEAIYRYFDGEMWTEYRSDVFSSRPPYGGDAQSGSHRDN